MPTIHAELSGFQDEVIALLDSGDFFDIEGPYDPVEFYASIPKKAMEEYIAASEKKNSRVWGILTAFLIGGAITAGFMQVRKDYPKQEKQYLAKAEAQPKKYPQPRTAKDIADEYIAKHGGELIKNMNRSDQKKLVAYIWSNSQRNERPLTRQIKNEPHIQSILDTGKHRTATIIRQERQRAINYAATAHATDIGAKTRTRMEKQDTRTRPSHRALRGETVPIDKPYSNGEMYPNQIDINCRGSQLFDF
jgi:SPP1 gp7 family putative phage head morphogenesis protein